MSTIKRLTQKAWGVAATTLLSILLVMVFWLPSWGAGTCTEFVSDGGFEYEIDPYVPSWVQTSTNFGSPLCTLETCGFNFARTGSSWWAWFGGLLPDDPTADLPEVAALEQNIMIPAGGVVPLQFFLRTEETGITGYTDFVRLTLDGYVLFSTTADNTTYTSPEYLPVTLNLSDFADGGSHTLRFESTINSTTSFFIDDVSRPDKKFVNISKLVNFADDLLQTIIDKTLLSQEIRAQAYDSKEDIVVNLDNTAAELTLKGGFGCDFSEMIPGAMTTIRSLEIRSGKVIARNLILKGSL